MNPISFGSGIVSPTEIISSFLDHHLHPFVHALSDYTKDNYASDALPPDTILVLVDIKSLYVNTPHANSLAAHERFLDTCLNPRKPSTIFLLLLAHFVLIMNIRSIENYNYLQIKVTDSYGHSYNNLSQDVRIQQLSILSSGFFMLMTFLIWTHGQEALVTFLQYLNCTYPVKITYFGEHNFPKCECMAQEQQS